METAELKNTVILPAQLRNLTGGRDSLKINTRANRKEGERITLRDCLSLTETEAPGLASRILDKDGKLRRFIIVYVDGGDSRVLLEAQSAKDHAGKPQDAIPELNPLDLRLNGFEEVTILPAIAGG